MYDLVIKNGTVIDGTGKERFLADIGITGDTITAVGNLSRAPARREINAAGLFIAPGFIDITNHSDVYWTLFDSPNQESLLVQGITTIIGGVCGSSIAPLINGEAIASIQKWSDPRNPAINWLRMDEFLESVENLKLAVNFGSFVGHATLRRGIVGDAFRALTKDELEKMKGALSYALDAGALGLSTGLAYSHARSSTIEELKALAHILKEKGGVYHTHLRNETTDLLLAVNEAVRIGREVAIPVHIAHFKSMGKENWNLFPKALDMIKVAAESGLRISFDFYPYTSTATVLYTLLPEWVSDGGKAAILKRLRDASIRKHVINDLKWNTYDYGSITVAQAADPSYTGKTITELARRGEIAPEEALINTLLASENRVIVFVNTISDDNVKHAVLSPYSHVSTAAAGYSLHRARGGNLVHPRSFGTFPRACAHFVKEREILSWEEAIAKMTLRPARFLNISHRGVIEEKAKGDIVVFDPQTIGDRATFENPFQYPRGIEYVLVNGSVAVEEGQPTGVRRGAVIRRRNYGV